MSSRRAQLVIVCLAGAVAAGESAWAVPPAHSEPGLRGLRRLELVFVNVSRERMAGGIVSGDAADSKESVRPAAARQDLANDPDCQAIRPELTRAGVEVVESCRGDDAACGKLLLTMETSPTPGGEDQMYLVELELTQRARLVRHATADLSVPTWSEHRFGHVGANHSATRTACIQLRDLATWFAAVWAEGNK